MKNQVLNIEQMKELEELGINISNASMCWSKWNNAKEYNLFAESKACRESFIQDLIEHNCVDEENAQRYAHNTIPAFTLQDILEVLPRVWEIGAYNANRNTITVFLDDETGQCHQEVSDSLLDAAFNMLKWCKRKNYN